MEWTAEKNHTKRTHETQSRSIKIELVEAFQVDTGKEDRGKYERETNTDNTRQKMNGRCV